MENPPVSVFAYTDFRLFLADAQRARKAEDPKFSHRFVAQRVGAGSAGWFADVVKGRIRLTGTHLVKLASLLKLKAREAAYFEALVDYDQAASQEERSYHYRKLLAFKEVKSDLVGRQHFEFYSRWYYGAVRELLFFHDFRDDHPALGRKLSPPIKAEEARKAVELLESLGMIRRDADGAWRPVNKTLRKDSAFKSLHLFNLLKENAELGVDALKRFDKDERDVSCLTLSFSREGFEKAREEIKALRKRLLALTGEDPHPDKVYQCNFQMFPVTH